MLIFLIIMFVVSLTADAQYKLVATGPSNIFNVQYPANLPAIPNGMMFTFFSNQTITGPAQLNLNGFGNTP
ncbi:MAG: hypothetical protein K2Q22_10035, partial [Cytophagales bacterium]|nr:hypothetical protein [Cytophagales bacterium]